MSDSEEGNAEDSVWQPKHFADNGAYFLGPTTSAHKTLLPGSMFGAFGGGPGMFGSFQDLMRSASTGGSFQELMRSATSGSLHFEESELMRSATLNGIRAGESVMELDEGYIGEQEWGGGDCSDFSPLSGEDETEEDKREDGGAEEDKREDGWGLGYDSVEEDGGAEDGSEYSDRVEEGTNNKTAVGVHLGDCGCITAEGDGSEEVLSEESDSEESECEEEITIEVDLSQEIYTPPTQDIGPYKKRKRAPKNDTRPNCRKPRVMGAIERAMRSASAKKQDEYIFEPIVGMVFDSRQEARYGEQIFGDQDQSFGNQ